MSSDMEGITRSILLLCLISLTNANSAPDINTFIYEVCEDTPTDAVAFTIDASDRDNDPLTYVLTGSNTVYFAVDSNTGSVTVRRRLDRESGEVMTLGVIVSDGRNERIAELTIVLREANDNPPIFQESSYDISIPENTAVGASLFTVRATDDDTSSGGIVKYSIDEVTPNEGFNLFSIVTTTGEVRLNGQLNYTTRNNYRLMINATDGGGKCYFPEPNFFSSIAYSFVTVTDVPDLDPLFIGLPYMGRVEEHSLVGQSVLKVIAIDQDSGINDELIYSIESSSVEGLFTISSNDGVISVLADIDREAIGDTVTLTVKATESNLNIHGIHASTTASVQITILDKNDNSPLFYKCEGSGDELSCVEASTFTVEVLEHYLGAVSFNMMVNDPDQFSRTQLILEGDDKDVFSVEPPFASSESIVQLQVRQPQALDYELKHQMFVQVIAIDTQETSFRSTATVTINLIDTNDNSPKFSQDIYRLTVPEHSAVGTELATITATDPDTMDQGNITYSLLPDSIRLYFDVDADTGTVRVKNDTLLDREVRSLYSATLQATDTDGKPGTTVLEITLTDINDQPPVIIRDSYLEFVKEGGQLDVRIQATDADEPNTANSQIVFAIVPSRYSDNFTIDPNTGVLRNKDELDREALDPALDGRIELNVTATDKGTPPLSTTVTVIINVEDVNDNAPEFEKPFYKFSVKEGEKGAFVGSVHAKDLDQTTDFNRISFSIIDGSAGSFIIRTFAETDDYKGDITVDPDVELDYESARKQFELKVEAADLERKKAIVTVEVEVLDVNDERPVFSATKPVEVKENTNISEPIGRFTATDRDGNHSLVYELESVNCRCDNILTPCDWFILDPTGDVRVNPEHIVDYEQCHQAEVVAQVVDEYTEKGENNSATPGRMVIDIIDINDNAPEFLLTDSVLVVVSETASRGTTVAYVTATDRDSGVNRVIEFEVTAVQFEDMDNNTSPMRTVFEAFTQPGDVYVGRIQTTEALDMTLRGKYLVTVDATDTGGLFDTVVLEIFTVDESYKVELKFESTAEEVERKLPEIERLLEAATQATVDIVEIQSAANKASRATEMTILVTYFVYPNGTALTSKEVEKMLSVQEYYVALYELGLRVIGQPPVEGVKENPVLFALAGMVGGLIIALAILTTSLMCTRRNYRRKLKAAKAMNSASMMTSDNQKSGPVVPGTNKYTMEGANPVLNLNIDTAMALDLDEESDVDKVSLNSLDYSDDMTAPEKGTPPGMHMIQEEEEDSGPPEYIEPLGAALAQRGQKKSSNEPGLGFNNPAFSTTDL